jgi:phosphoglycerate dehydrogenase-like enzyme
MKLLFFTNDKRKIYEVFSEKIIYKIKERFEVIGFYGIKELDTNLDAVRSAEIIVTTWDIPYLKSDQIRYYFPILKNIYYTAGESKHILKNYKDSGIKIIDSKSVNSEFVADYILGMIIVQSKNILMAQKKYKLPFYRLSYNKARQYVMKSNGNYKKVVGLIGIGSIGRYVLKKLQSLNYEILVYDPFISLETLDNFSFESVELEELFTRSDIISSHLPDNENTKNAINSYLIGKMKNNVVFINTGREAQVDYKALTKFMKRNKYASAILDVTNHEPVLPTSRLLRCDNIFITPHIAGSFSKERYLLGEYIFLKLTEDFLNN